MTLNGFHIITITRSHDFWFTLRYGEEKLKLNGDGTIFSIFRIFTGSGVSLSSSDGLGVVPRELFEVVRGVLDLDKASESLHCSTSTSSSSSPSTKRLIDAGPILIQIQFD